MTVTSLPPRPSGKDSYRPKNRQIARESGCYLGELFEAEVGLSILNICDLELASKTFYGEGIVWLKYERLPGWLDHWDEEIIKAPVKALRFVNTAQRSDLTIEVEPNEPVKDEDGLMIQWAKFSGRFVANSLDLSSFPFETVQLPIEIELEDLYESETCLALNVDSELLASGGTLTGYKLKEASIDSRVHTYKSNWGWKLAESCNGAKNLSEFDNICAVVEYQRSIRSSLLEVFLPLFVIMIVLVCAPLLDIRQHENRVILPASVLLVLVFLQEGYKRVLPPGLSYPTIADLIYSCCFTMTVFSFGWGLYTANCFLSHQPIDAAEVQALNSSSQMFVALSIVYLAISFASIISLSRLGIRLDKEGASLRAR